MIGHPSSLLLALTFSRYIIFESSILPIINSQLGNIQNATISMAYPLRRPLEILRKYVLDVLNDEMIDPRKMVTFRTGDASALPPPHSPYPSHVRACTLEFLCSACLTQCLSNATPFGLSDPAYRLELQIRRVHA